MFQVVFPASFIVGNPVVYGRRRIYQYNEDDVRFQLGFLSNFQIAWVHVNMETKRRCQFTASHCLLINL